MSALHSGTPFWPARDGIPATYPPLRSSAVCEVVVLGAGITGALLAHRLSRAGADVVVIDRGHVASGSSAATTGLLLYDTDTSLRELSTVLGPRGAERVYHLGVAAIDEIEALAAELGNRCGFRRRPSLYVASRRRDVRALRAEYDARRQSGLSVSWMSRHDLASQHGLTAPAAIRSDQTAEIDCYQFAHHLLAAAARQGARVHARTPVAAIATSHTGVDLQLTGGAHVRGRQLIVATGYELPLPLPITSGRLASTWAFASEPLEHFTGWEDRCLVWETARPYLYVRSTEDGRLLAGGEDEPYPFRHRRSRTMEAKTERLLRRVRLLFPSLEIEPAFKWAGVFATTEDGLPFIGQVPQYPHTWFALGYGGNGITFSVIAARLLSDALRGRRNDDASLFAFNRGRTAGSFEPYPWGA